MYLSDNKSSQQASFTGSASLADLGPLPSTSDAQHSRQISRSNIWSFPQAFKALTAFNAFNHFFKIKVDAQRVLCELWRHHPCRGLFVRVESIDLCLEVVAVWVTIVETDGRAMIDVPIWFNAESLSLAIGQEQLRDIVKSECGMLGCFSLLTLASFCKVTRPPDRMYSRPCCLLEGITTTAMR